jgi:hypothetical protein
MEGGHFQSGCTTLPSPEGKEGDLREWCRIQPEDMAKTMDPSKSWGYCTDEIDYDSLRQYSYLIVDKELGKIGFYI